MLQEPRRRSFGKLALGLAAAIGVVVFGLWGFQKAVKSERQLQRASYLRSIGLGVDNFEGVYRRLPDPVLFDEQRRPLSSWRFQISLYMEALMRDADCEAPWDDPANKWLTSEPHPAYCLPSMRSDPETLDTNVVLVTGPGTAFDGEHTYRLREIDNDQILAIELADTGIPWAAPGDLSIEKVTPQILQGLDGDGVHVLFADGEVAFVPAEASFADLKKFFTVQGAKENDREDYSGTLFDMVKKPSHW